MVTDTVSSEFKYYARLKCRMAISEIQLTVTDPRGRFAKTIVVHFLPRPVSDVNQLKSNDCKWQACATFSLTRGQSRVSSVLSEPVVAANLMIEYVDFYERPGGSTGEDGTLLIHCPRCTRIVHNAHGVCGNCGEVAFQCRKCRHINYDRLDAFLCVECGYCSAGSFGYELNAGMASNAVAIIDEESYERTVSILREAKQLHEELETALKEKVRLATSKRPRTEDDSALSDFSPALKRAYLGKVPLIFGEGSEARTSGTAEQSARSRSNSEANRSSSRVSSLLRLARQLRASGGESISELENELAGMDSSDQVAALVRHANDIAASRSAPESSAGGRPRSSTNETRSRSNSEATPKVTLEECEKLYQLMREAERECYELQLRIDAWQRLEHDNLLDLEDESEDKTKSRTITSFQPCHCMACCGPIALNLLILTMKLIQSDPERMDRAISQKLIRVLLNEYHGMDKDLRDLKRMAIMTLAGKSTKRASELVLEELRARLVTFNDPTTAEILGKILETQPEIDEAYVKLATDTLGGGY
jgi:E3 ubiquitin-protein ligase UBR4